MFIVDTTRCMEPGITSAEARYKLAIDCLLMLNHSLQCNVCNFLEDTIVISLMQLLVLMQFCVSALFVLALGYTSFRSADMLAHRL
jgi:hypothetical protein